MVSIWGKEGNGRPAVLVIAEVNVGPLGFFDADGHEKGVEKGDYLIVGKRTFIHALAKATPESGDEQEHRLVLLPSLLESVVTPLPPPDQVGPVGANGKAKHVSTPGN